MATVRASHILLMYNCSARSIAVRTKEEVKTQTEALKRELDAGAEFAELARQRSDCPSSRDGGNLGSFGRGRMVGAFENTAFALTVGQTSSVVETEFGFHIVQRTG